MNNDPYQQVDYSPYFREITSQLVLLNEIEQNQTELVQRTKINEELLSQIKVHNGNMERIFFVELGLIGMIFVLMIVNIISIYIANFKE